MTNTLKISIVTPSFNQANYLEQTIQSVLDQDYPNLEYIIMDGGSTDGSVEIIRKYEKYIAHWESNSDKGQSDAINKGLKYCTGDIFNWLNSDDYYNSGALKTVAKAFHENGADVIGGRERAFYSSTGETTEIFNGTQIKGNVYELIYHGIIDQPPTFWNMKTIRALGPLPINLHYTMDAYWWIKYLLLSGLENVFKIEDILTNFRLHEHSKSMTAQDNFEVERLSLRKELAHTLNFNTVISQYYEDKDLIPLDGIFNDCKNLLSADIKKLESVFAAYIYPLYYMKYDLPNAKAAFKIFKRYSAINIRFISDFIKLLLIPGFVLSALRKLK